MTVTSVLLLAIFCWTLAGFSVAQRLLADSLDRVAWGTTMVVVAIAMIVSAVALLEQSHFALFAVALLAFGGAVAAVAGAMLLVQGAKRT